MIGQDKHSQQSRLHSSERLRDQQQLSLLEAIHQHSAVGAKEQHRQKLEGDRKTDRGGRAGDLQDEPAHGDGLDPRSDERYRLTGKELPVVGLRQRDKRANSHQANSLSCTCTLALSVRSQRPRLRCELAGCSRGV